MNVVKEIVNSTATANMLLGGIDGLFTRTDSGGTSSALTDGLGSTLALTNSSGAVQTEYTYDPFGNTSSTGSTSSNPSQYTGRENDGTGLYYYRARYYSPALQRFISEDPIGFEGGDINLYSYVWNNPLSFTDPTGHDGWGNDMANWLDEKIENARQYYQSDVQDWAWNGSVDTAADLASGTADMLRVGSGVGHAIYDEDENGYGRAAFVAMDVRRASGIFTLLGAPAARFSNSAAGCSLNNRLVKFTGKEIKFSNDFRIAPLGNRTGHPIGRFTHYHRRVKLPDGTTKPGQGIGRHRPFEKKSTDTSFLDRF